jgi:predicted TIM-barrel fold metal-dependent hydrolase
MIIDAHVHLKHGGEPYREYTADEIIGCMDAVGIGVSVVFAMSTTASRAIEMAAEAAGKYPGRLIPYAYGLPAYERSVLPDIRRAVNELGFRGIKLHIGECSLAEHVSGPVLDLAGELGVPCLIDFGGQLRACQGCLEHHPHTTFLIAHLGRYLSQDEHLAERFLELAEQHENAYMDCSGIALPRLIAKAVRRLGAERVIWGTDGPHAWRDGDPYRAENLAEYAREEMDKVRNLELTPEERAAVLGGSAAALLGLRQ